MAKEKTTKPAASVAAKAAQKVGKETLTQNPDLKEVFVTSDGVSFFTRNDAQNHAHILKNRDVFNIKRDKPEADSGEESPAPEPVNDNPENNDGDAETDD